MAWIQARRQWWREACSERGNVAIVFALAMPVVVGAAGLAVETSYDYVAQVHLQAAADAAAYAAAIENRGAAASEDPRRVETAAKTAATSNSWSSADGTILVSTPPTSGSHTGPNATEVVLTRSLPRFFSAYFSQSPIVARARAVAIYQTASNACILALSKTQSRAIQVQGSSVLTLNGCDVMANSVSDEAVKIWGSGKLTADCVASSGGVSTNGGLTLTQCSSPVTQAPRAKDPFAALPTPATGANRTVPNNPHGLPITLSPGHYSHGLSLSGNVTLSPGVYYVAGGDFKVNANANVSGSGVSIFTKAGSRVSINGNATVNLSAPTAGTYAGILFFGDRNGTGQNTFNGTASSSLTGDLYYPSQDIDYQGNFTGVNGCTHIVANTVQWNGNATVSANCATEGLSSIPAQISVRLVE